MHLSATLPPQRWSSIQKMHLQYHFGYGLWYTRREPCNRIIDPLWQKTWKTLSSSSPGLRQIQLDLDAYLATESMDPEFEAEVFEPLKTVTVASTFIVRVSWVPNPQTLELDLPFQLLGSLGRKDNGCRDVGNTAQNHATPRLSPWHHWVANNLAQR